MKVLNQLFKKNKDKDKSLAAAAYAIVELENKLAQKEEKAEGLRVSLGQLYQDAALDKKDSNKINQIKVELEEMLAEIEGIKSVIDSAKTEAIDLAQTEIQKSLAAKAALKEQMKLETNEENTRILSALKELMVTFYRLYGVKGVIAKSPSFHINIPTDGMLDEDIALTNKELAKAFDKTTDGPASIAAQIKEIEDHAAKSSPEKALEKALQDARSSKAQSVSQKAA